jgi:hypothetical protein
MNNPFINLCNTAFWLLLVCFLSSCHHDSESTAPSTRRGFRPVYISYEEMRNVHTMAAQPMDNPGKIYIHGNYIFINEINKGIHIINNQDPASPQAISFISIPGNVDMAVKNNVLYADNSTDLISLDISNPDDVQLLNRIENTFPYRQYPPYSGYFECVDPSRGIVASWESAQLDNPKCYR